MFDASTLDLGIVPIPALALVCGLIVFAVALVSGSDWLSARRLRRRDQSGT